MLAHVSAEVAVSEARPLRGRTALALIRALALGAESERELAEQFGVSGPAIHGFKRTHAERIESARLEIENEFAGLWSASKAARIAELEAEVERLTDALDVAPLDLLPKLANAKRSVLRSIAEELGQLAPRAINVGTVVRYAIAGVDPDLLR